MIMIRQHLFLPLLLCLFLLTPLSSSANWFPTEAELELRRLLRTVNYYFESVNMGNPDELRLAYHPEATFSFVDKNDLKLKTMPVSNFIQTVGQDSYIKYQRNIQVTHIDITGQVASVETVIDYPQNGKKLYDFLSLIKLDGAWRIVSRASYKEHDPFYRQPNWQASTTDLHAMESAILDYFKGGNRLDAERLGRAMHPQARMMYRDERSGQLKIQDKEDYIEVYTGVDGRKFRRSLRINYLHAKGNVGMAKVTIRFKQYKSTLTDYLTLVKENGEWKILRKVSDKKKMRYLSSL